jgi:peptide deformylase
MSVLKVVKYPDPVLKKVCAPVTAWTPELQVLLDNMCETMYADEGMGIAANQVGVSLRIFIMDENPEFKQPLIFINPEIVFESEETDDLEEGCLSFPGIRIAVKRPIKVVVKALDREQKEFLCEREGYAARCLLHELDHLNGITFFERISQLKRKIAEKKLAKFRHTAAM